MSDYYKGQARGYSSDAEVIKTKLNTLKTKYQKMLDDFGVSKVNGNLQYTVAEGDYLTDNVVESLDSSITEIDSIIGEIDGRITAINNEASRLDTLADQEAAENNDTTDGDSSSETPSDAGGTNE